MNPNILTQLIGNKPIVTLETCYGWLLVHKETKKTARIFATDTVREVQTWIADTENPQAD